MVLTNDMVEDIQDNITWIPRASGFITTLTDVALALNKIGYSVDVRKIN